MQSQKLAPVSGSYAAHLGRITITGTQLRRSRRRPCPVCCPYLGRDRDMVIVTKRGQRFWICESSLQVEDQDCGFVFPDGIDQSTINKLARAREQHLRGG